MMAVWPVPNQWFLVFKQKTAYDIPKRDWSSDVCSSDLAMQAHSEGNPGRVLELLEKHQPRAGQPDLRGWEWRYLWKQTRSDELFTFGRPADHVSTVAFSPEGRALVSASSDGTAKIWDVASRRTFRILEHPDQVRAAIYSRDGRWVVTACRDGNVRFWDTADWSVRRILPESDLDGISLAPNGRLLATTSTDNVKLWDIESGQVVGRWPAAGAYPIGTAFSSNGTIFAFSGRNGEIVLWDPQKQSKISSLRGHADSVSSLAFSADGKTLVSGGWDNTVRVWDLNSYSERPHLTGFSSWVACVALSPDGRALATANTDHQTRLWDTTTWAELATLVGHSDEVWGVAFSPDGTHLATASKDETIRWWENKPKPANRESLRRFSSSIPHWNWIRPSPDGSAVVTVHGSRSNRVTTLWQTRDLTDVSLAQLPEKTLVVGVAPSTQLFALSQASTGSNGPIVLWSAKDQRAIATLSGEGEGILRSAFSLDGSMLAVGRAEGRVEIWNVSQQTLAARFDGPRSPPLRLTFTPNGEALAVAYENSVLILWDVKRSRQIA